jgi:glycosyltransferase involved in cell wall biosynthesis
MDYKFSIITPTHNQKDPTFLIELFASLASQTYKNWEWILYLNGDCQPSDIPDMIKFHPRVRVIRTDDISVNVGAIKKAAFSIGSGDILVEVDHDDILIEDCLEELNKAYQDIEVGFVYSDDVIYNMKEEFIPFNPLFGWEHYDYEWRGQTLKAMRSFEPTSQCLGYIWYAPDHVRSWRASVYKEVGGHNPDLSICDDHELCIRTYLITKMYHIPKVLYVYRVTGDNTFLKRFDAIQKLTVEIFNYYAVALAEKDATDKGLLKVDLGGGINKRPGYISIDQTDGDIICDLNEGIPLEDNSVGVINASHVLEHLKDPIKSMREIHRVLAHGGWAFIEVPSTDGRGAFQDPTHISFWNENSFLYYTDENLAKYIRNTDIRFQEFRRETWFPNEWMQSINVPVVTAWLVCIKDGNRFPHTLKI